MLVSVQSSEQFWQQFGFVKSHIPADVSYNKNACVMTKEWINGVEPRQHESHY